MADETSEIEALRRELDATRDELKKYRFLLDLVPFYVSYVDRNLTYQLHNSGAKDWYPSPETLLGLHLSGVVGPEAFDYIEEQLSIAMAGRSVEYDRRIRFGDISRHVRVNYEPHVVDGEVVGVGTVIENMTARRRSEERLRQAAAVFDASRDAIMIFDSKHLVVRVNSAFTELTGYDSAEAHGERAASFTVPIRGNSLDLAWDNMVRDGHWSGELYFRHKDGSIRHVWVTVSCVADERNYIHNYVAVLTSMETNDTLSHLAHHDALTGLPNRLLLQARMEHTLERAQRQARPAAVMYIDLDQFKPVNDAFGHAEGDSVLIEVGKRLSAIVRAQDTVARLGGDEFVVLLDEYSSVDDVGLVAHRILEALSQPFNVATKPITVGGSIGVAIFPEDAQTADDLLKCADKAMYEAKLAGRGTAFRHGTDQPLI
ncbi:MAG: sensor domain-containing diguanylate cyclase [bacterium]